jgi:hypothetical protein
MAIKVSGVTIVDNNRNVVNANIKGKQQNLGAISGVNAVNLNNGETVIATIAGNTTFTLSNLVSGSVNTIFFYLTNPGVGTLTWPPSTTWDKGNYPILNASGKTLIILESYDNGANWIGVQAWRQNV